MSSSDSNGKAEYAEAREKYKRLLSQRTLQEFRGRRAIFCDVCREEGGKGSQKQFAFDRLMAHVAAKTRTEHTAYEDELKEFIRRQEGAAAAGGHAQGAAAGGQGQAHGGAVGVSVGPACYTARLLSGMVVVPPVIKLANLRTAWDHGQNCWGGG
jgi:hypothetical protein